MENKFHSNDPRDVWQSQTMEPFKTSIDQLRHKAQQRQARARLVARFNIIVGILLSIFFAWSGARGGGLFPRAGLGLLSLWCLYFSYQAYQWTWPGRIEMGGTLGTTLGSYRSELEKQRDYSRNIWRRAGLTYCLVGLALIIVPELIKALKNPRLLLNVAPVGVLLALWLALFFPQRKRRQQKLQREIEELRAFERESAV